jgi:hypothetical protein
MNSPVMPSGCQFNSRAIPAGTGRRKASLVSVLLDLQCRFSAHASAYAGICGYNFDSEVCLKCDRMDARVQAGSTGK